MRTPVLLTLAALLLVPARPGPAAACETSGTLRGDGRERAVRHPRAGARPDVARLEPPGARPQEHYLLIRCNQYDNPAETSCTSYSRTFFL